MDLDIYKRAKKLQEETFPAFERLKKAVSVGSLSDSSIQELAESLADAMFLEKDFAVAIKDFIENWAERFKKEFGNL